MLKVYLFFSTQFYNNKIAHIIYEKNSGSTGLFNVVSFIYLGRHFGFDR